MRTQRNRARHSLQHPRLIQSHSKRYRDLVAMTTIIQLLLVLGLMVLVHEFGHFVVAKWCGVRVEAFAIGFGKRLVGFVRGGTDYRSTRCRSADTSRWPARSPAKRPPTIPAT